MNNPFSEIDARLSNIESLLLELKQKPFIKESKQKLTIKEVSKELSVSELTIHNYIKRGTLPAVKIGRRIYINRIDLDNALKEVKNLKYRRR